MKNNKREYQRCVNCVMDTTDSLIEFDQRGVCDHCNNYYENILPNWHPDEKGAKELNEIVTQIKAEGEDQEFDCIIGVSGGVDSSYLLYYATEILGLRPLAFAVDTGWNTEIAENNIRKLVNGLGLDLYTEKINQNEMNDLQLAYFKSQVPYQDTPQDHVIFAALYNLAVKKNVKYVLTGGNYSTECVREPIEWVYMNDLKQIKDIHNKFGKIPLETLPTCSMFKYRLYYKYIKGMQVIKPLDLIPYNKEHVIDTLNKKFDWQPYKNKHYESIFTRFYEGYWLIEKFGFDKRKAHFSSLILTGQLKRHEALKILKEPPYSKDMARKDLEFIADRLDITPEKLIQLMKEENKNYKDYKNDAGLIKAGTKIASLIGIEKRNFR